MSILSTPINEDAITENALVRFISDNVWKHQKPYIGFTDDKGVTDLRRAGRDLLWRADSIGVRGSFLDLNRKRMLIVGEFDWQKYGIDTIYSEGTVIFEQNAGQIPENITGQIIYFNDCYSRFTNHYINAFSVVFTKFWFDKDGGLYDVILNCGTLKFNDPPKTFHNVTGKCEEIIIRCDELADVPGLRAGLIQQTLNGKKINSLKDLRAYYNNPKKYPYTEPNKLFDTNAFVKAAGLDKLRKLNTIRIKDAGIEITFNKPTKWWGCTSIKKL